jgi:hypothetical protein
MDNRGESRIKNLNEGSLSSSERQITEARILVERLERLSADSYWAHQASGMRGALLRAIALFESSQDDSTNQPLEIIQASQLNRVMGRSFEILVRAARDMHR